MIIRGDFMKYSRKFKIDLGETSIENIFWINIFMATGNQPKVYLYAYSLPRYRRMWIFQTKNRKGVDLTEGKYRVLELLVDEGIIKRYTDAQTQTNHTVFFSLRQLYLELQILSQMNLRRLTFHKTVKKSKKCSDIKTLEIRNYPNQKWKEFWNYISIITKHQSWWWQLLL